MFASRLSCHFWTACSKPLMSKQAVTCHINGLRRDLRKGLAPLVTCMPAGYPFLEDVTCPPSCHEPAALSNTSDCSISDMWACRLSEALSPERALPFLQAGASSLTPGNPAPVQINGCRALMRLIPKLSKEMVQPSLQQIYTGKAPATLHPCTVAGFSLQYTALALTS